MRIAEYSIHQKARSQSIRSEQTKKSYQVISLEYQTQVEEDKTFEKGLHMTLFDTLLAILSNQRIIMNIPSVKHQNDQPIITSITQVMTSYDALDFHSTGIVQTQDGNLIDFNLDLHLSKLNTSILNQMNYYNGQLIDPIALNIDNKGLDLSNKKLHIDLDLDGRIDTFNMLKKGSGYLVLDKNNNGKVDDGSELFGPTTDNGFAELRFFDEDGNLWIDENDSVYDRLKIWTLDEDGTETFLSLKEANVGAMFLGQVEGKYDLKGYQKKGHIRNSSVFLRNDGTPGSIHELKV
jgi:hypothetical protein